MKGNQKLEAKYGLFMAISMVIGQVIGSGIFFKVDDVLIATDGNVYAGLLGFLIVGIGVVFAAISMANYAELLPGNSGILGYVEYRFGKRVGAYVGWVYFSMFFPLLTAVLLTVSGIYISHFLAMFVGFEPNFLHYCSIGILNSFLFLGLNIFSPKSSGIFQQTTTVLKLLPLILISSLGIVSIISGHSELYHTGASATENLSEQVPFWFLVAGSFIPISFSMDGWYTGLQLSGEVKNSQKNLPRALVIGSVVVLVVYVFYYLGIVSKMSVREISTLRDTYIIEFANRIGGRIGEIFMQLCIIISVLGTSNGLFLASSRVPYQFYHLEKSKKFLNLGKINSKTQLPLNSIFLAFVMILFYMVIYAITNMLPFFMERQYDISALPILFIYLVNLALFLGLFKLISENKFKGNKLLKYFMLVFAIFGTGLVIVGSVIAPNGFSYFLIVLFFLGLGYFFVRK